MSKLSIVIPAYNEEKAISATIQRCLAARDTIMAATDMIDDVEIIVVDDGSRDRTAEIAAGFSGVTLISHEVNKGYGAALKSGFAAAKGEVLGFLDADGTCDPMFFSELCRALEQERADIAIGSRLNSQSRMPLTRVIGNVVYALLLGALSDRAVTDTASGMRVIRRASLSKIYPLPDGMDFTPAMSAKALFDDELTIVESPMPYSERVGASKLRILSDGMRFLKSIIDGALMYKPSRVFSFIAAPIMIVAILFSIYPIEFYLKHQMLEEWMIYRLITVMMCYHIASMLLTGSILSEKILAIIDLKRRRAGFFAGLLSHLITPKTFQVTGGLLFIVGIALNYETILEYSSTGRIYVHWSKVLIGGFLVSTAANLFVTSIVLRTTEVLAEKERWNRTLRPS